MLRIGANPPVHWRWKRLEEIAEINPRGPSLANDDFVSFLGMADVSETGRVIGGGVRKLCVVKTGFTPFRNRDVLVAKITPCFENGKGALVDGLRNGVGFGSTEFHVLRANGAVLPEFLFLHTRTGSFRLNGEANMTGSAGQKRVPPDFIRDWTIPLPPLEEQRRIVEVLHTWDEASNKVAQLFSKKVERAVELRRQLLTFEPHKKFALEDVVSPISRKVVRPDQPYRALSVRSHGKGTFQRVVEDPSSVAMEHLYQVQPGDLIVNITFAWEGAVALVEPEDAGCLVSHRFPTFRIDTGKINPRFLRHITRTKRFFHMLKLISPGGAGRNRVLNQRDFLKLEIPVPERRQQDLITQVLDTADREIEKTWEFLQRIESQRCGLTKKLLTGEWRVGKRADESVHVPHEEVRGVP